MEYNTLVRHKKNKSWGIGCISKVHTKTYSVNFGLEEVISCKHGDVIAVDVSKTKTVYFNEFKNRILHDNSKLDKCIVGNELKEYVGIGWVTLRVITEQDLLTYPRVVK